MIVIDTSTPDVLWLQICTAVRGYRFQGWELLANGHLALFEWPTRHTKMLLRGNPNPAKCRLVLFEQTGALPRSYEDLKRYQEEFSAAFHALFFEYIKRLRIADVSIRHLNA